VSIDNQSPAEKAADWAWLRAESEKTYKPSIRISKASLNERVEFDALRVRAETIKVEIASIGNNGTNARARVTRGDNELFDTGECRKQTMEARLGRFLAQQLHVEAMRAAG
jgi:hypothetical protein